MGGFSVLVLTAAPPGQSAEAGGAFVKIDGREALLRSVELFLNRQIIIQIQVIVLPEMLEEAKRKFGHHFGFSGVKLFAAGPRWVDQLEAAAGRLAGDAQFVIVHDGARPIVPAGDIDALLEAAPDHPAVALTAPLKSALLELDEGGSAVATHLPSNFVHLLTPVAYGKDSFLQLAESRTDIHPSRLSTINGSPLNIRVGSPADVGVAKAFLNLLPKAKSKPRDNPFEEAQW